MVGKDAPPARLSRGFLPLLCGIESQTKTTHKRKETTSQNKEHLCHAHIVATAPSIEDALILNAYPSNAATHEMRLGAEARRLARLYSGRCWVFLPRRGRGITSFPEFLILKLSLFHILWVATIPIQRFFNDQMDAVFVILKRIRCINAPCGAFMIYYESWSVKERPRRVSAVAFFVTLLNRVSNQKTTDSSPTHILYGPIGVIH